MDFFIFILNIAVGWGLTLYLIKNADGFPQEGGGFILGLMTGIVVFFVLPWLLIGMALCVLIYRINTGRRAWAG